MSLLTFPRTPTRQEEMSLLTPPPPGAPYPTGEDVAPYFFPRTPYSIGENVATYFLPPPPPPCRNLLDGEFVLSQRLTIIELNRAPKAVKLFAFINVHHTVSRRRLFPNFVNEV